MLRRRIRLGARASRRGLLAGVVLAASFVVFGGGSAWALSGEFAAFSECPYENPEVAACIVGTDESGEFTIGKKTVPITNPIKLQGGLVVNKETGAVTFAPAINGETLSKSPQKVPGGLLGIEGLGGEVTATAELAGPASSIVLNQSNLITESGTALSIPLKLKLGNPFLGSKCVGGSNAHPIVIEFTTGTTSPPAPNKPIKGKAGKFFTTEEGAILNITENTLVNNSFAAPGVRGCGLIPPLVDPLVDAVFGVPASAGKNTAVLSGKFQIAEAEEVREHA